VSQLDLPNFKIVPIAQRLTGSMYKVNLSFTLRALIKDY
jgi:hypothetical protein